eukprot:CAMPEP_0173227548 /NCGR_PEP_ID=MMETSP1142-20121109/6024_1 /TAXON_ID=483371 /ORGANISM="non described non described, Strain CCMP2298" /LENGTH=576 /DNA_ID=CAMNT_0014156075 /DNA_START=58 /DNA_END=1785 /DNA_ORIENTATION=-
MAALLLEGWLVKDGNMMGSWKNRYCSLTFDDTVAQFTFEYFVGLEKKDKKGAFTIARASGFKKAPNSGEIKNCFSIEVAAATGRKAGARVTLSAPSTEAFVLWERAFAEAKAPVGIMPGVGKSFGKPELVVVGAVGHLGAAVAQSLAAYTKDYSVVAVVPDVSSARNAVLSNGGVKLVQGDMGKPSSLASTLSHAKVALLVVPNVVDKAAIAVMGIKACKEAGVEHIVVLSVCSAELTGTILAEQYAPIEAYTIEVGVPYTICRLPMLMENILGQMQSIATKGEFYTPLEPGAQQICASVGDIGEGLAKVMAFSEKYVNKTLSLTGLPVTEDAFAEAFSAALGSPVTHVCVSYLDSKASMLAMGMPEWQADSVIEQYAHMNQSAPSVPSDLPAILKRELASPLTLAEYVGQGLRAMRAAHEYEVQLAVEAASEAMHTIKLVAAEAQAAVEAAEKAARDKATAEAVAKHVQMTRHMVNNGGAVLKKMGNEMGYKSRFVWIDDDEKKLCWSKGETKDVFKSIPLIRTLEISSPVFSTAKASSLFGVAEPDGFTLSITEVGKPSLDLKIEGTIEDAFVW